MCRGDMVAPISLSSGEIEFPAQDVRHSNYTIGTRLLDTPFQVSRSHTGTTSSN